MATSRGGSQLVPAGVVLILLAMVAARPISRIADSLGEGALRAVLFIGADVLRAGLFVGLGLLIIGSLRNRKRPPSP
jgi:hypothetical protein